MVKNIRLKNMIDLVAGFEDSGESKVTLTKPVEVSWDGSGGTYQMIMQPFIENNLTDATSIQLEKSDILYTVDMKPEMAEIYESYCGKFYSPRQIVTKKAVVKSLADYQAPPGKKN